MRALWISLSIVVVDQISKLLVKGMSIPWLGLEIEGMRYGSSIPILGNFFRLTYIENPGMAFGIDPGGKLFFSLFSLALSIGILYYLYHARNDGWGIKIALALILGGAIGNMIDRTFYGVLYGEGPLFHGKVVDFFDVDFFDIEVLGYSLKRWPVFNVADAAVTIGIVLLLVVQHRRGKSEQPSPTSTQPAQSDTPTDSPRP